MTTSTVDLLASLKTRKEPEAQKTGAPLTQNIPAWAAGKVPLGINPPEAALPPQAPVGSLVVAAAPVALVEPTVAIEKEKAKRGRPAGSKNTARDPLGADVHAYTSPAAPADPYEAAIAKASAGLSEYELRADAVKELAASIGSALSKFAASLEVSK